LAGSILNITVSSPSPPTGLGHFTISTGRQSHRFLKKPKFINGGDCSVTDGKNNPFVSNNWKYDFPTPPIGTPFDIWIAVYWHCDGKPHNSCSVSCTSENIYYRGYVY